MSRVANKPISLPKGAEFSVQGQRVAVKGPKGSMTMDMHHTVTVSQEGNELKVSGKKVTKQTVALSGTMRSLINNMIIGVTTGFERKLVLVGVGYRAQAQGQKLNLTLGFSHPVEYAVPEGVKVETPSQTEIMVHGSDKQQVGQVAADIRAYRPPEPYKGKGVRYSDERIILKEAKKK